MLYFLVTGRNLGAYLPYLVITNSVYADTEPWVAPEDGQCCPPHVLALAPRLSHFQKKF